MNIFKRISKSKKLKAILISLIVIVIIATSGGVFAKYRSEEFKEAEMSSNNFHISSDYLETDKKTYSVTDWTNGFSFEIYNFEKENTALISDTSISYKLTVSEPDLDISVKAKSSGSSEEHLVSGSNGVYELGKSDGTTTHTVTLKPIAGAEFSGDNVTVTVESVSPYKKILTAEFEFSGNALPVYTVEGPVSDNGDYFILTIQTNQYSGNIDVTWPSGLVCDNTNEIMKNWVGNNGSFNAESFTTYRLWFFNPSGTGSDSGFDVTPSE